MKKLIFVIFLTLSPLFGAVSVTTIWGKGVTFSDYLDKNNIPLNIMDNIEADDKKLLIEIASGIKLFELYDDNKKLLQSLIPVGREMQIQISLDELNDEYLFDIIPIIYGIRDLEATITINVNPHRDIINSTHNKKLARTIDKLFKKRINCKKLQKGNKIAIIYTQRERLNRPFLEPEVKAVAIQTGKKIRFIFVSKGEAYSDIYKNVSFTTKSKKSMKCSIQIPSQKFTMPLRNVRITSTFSYKRWHPILHRYRPHLGVDFGARRGTPLLAVANGRVIYAGWMGGYGRVVKIKHSNGFVSLYAHQSRIRVQRGQKVKRGQIIGYVGSTGRSTGPHLHFGLYKNNRAINPLSKINKRTGTRSKIITKIVDIVKTKKIEIAGARENKKRLIEMLKTPPKTFDWDNIKDNFVFIKDKPKG